MKVDINYLRGSIEGILQKPLPQAFDLLYQYITIYFESKEELLAFIKKNGENDLTYSQVK